MKIVDDTKYLIGVKTDGLLSNSAMKDHENRIRVELTDNEVENVDLEENQIKVLENGVFRIKLKTTDSEKLKSKISEEITLDQDIKLEKYQKIWKNAPEFMEIGNEKIYVLGNKINEDGTQDLTEYGITVFNNDLEILNFKSLLIDAEVVDAFVDDDDNLYICKSYEIVKYNSNIDMENSVEVYTVLDKNSKNILAVNNENNNLMIIRNSDLAIETTQVSLEYDYMDNYFINENSIIQLKKLSGEESSETEALSIKEYDYKLNLLQEKNIVLENEGRKIVLSNRKENLKYLNDGTYHYLLLSDNNSMTHSGTIIWKLDENFNINTKRELEGFFPKEVSFIGKSNLIGIFQSAFVSIFDIIENNYMIAFRLDAKGIDYFQSYNEEKFELDVKGNDIYLRANYLDNTRYNIEKFELKNIIQ